MSSEKLEKQRREELARVLDAMDAEHGKPAKADEAWAERVLARSFDAHKR